MLAGVLLGPSFVGRLFPDLEARLFPPGSLPALHSISQLGVVLFMFVVGMQVDVDRLRRRARAAVIVSNAGIIAPFALGSALSLYLYRDYAPAGVPLLTFALFIGIAMSITAFPVLARILVERGLTRTELGNIAIGCAAIDDVSAWCLLALVLAISRSEGFREPFIAASLAILLALVALKLVRPRVARFAGSDSTDRAFNGEAVSPRMLFQVLLFVLGSALATEAIGVHALFGSFIAGIALGGSAVLREALRGAIEPLTATLLLPLFFAYSGLRTDAGLLSVQGWLTCALIVVIAVGGKFGAISIVARLQGMEWRDSLSLGILMNTRGLMELVVLNIGYDLGILPPALYTMMVVMALTTTCMTGPLLVAIRADAPAEADAASG